MSGIEWPAGWDRTPPHRREPNRDFEATLAATSDAIRTEMDRMGVDKWRASTGSGGRYVGEKGLPKHNANPDDPSIVLRWTDDGEQFAVACDAYSRLRDNLRSVYLWVHETRMRSQRPVQTGEDEFAAARLPSGDGGAVVADPPAAEVLGVDADASDAEIQSAWKQKVIPAHPDNGGSDEELRRVNDARDELLGGDP